MKLAKDERKLLSSVERGEWRAVTDKNALGKYRDAARQTLKKDARLNIRISSHDLEILRKEAMSEGLPYQTFVSSLLHKYVTRSLAA